MVLRLSDLPVEVLLDNLFSFLPAQDLNHLARTSKFFALLSSDDTVWKRKLSTEFNFTGEGTARTSGWKTIYRGLYKPRVFVWGESANGRLGVENVPKASVHGVPFPFEVKIPNVRVVNLVAGGMSFHALDSDGNVHIWGTLDGSGAGALPSDGYSEPGKPSYTPLKLQLPDRVRSISCGRLHSSVLDRQNRVWTFVNWGRPFCFNSHALSNPLSTPIQLECGWMYSALLQNTGEVYVWWPFSGLLQQAIAHKNGLLDGEGNKKAQPEDGVIPCVPWATDIEPTRLPNLPPLPEFLATASKRKTPLRLVQIAGLEDTIIALTNQGHVLKFGSLNSEETVTGGRWEYLPKFSDIDFIRRDKLFAESEIEAPQTLQITHISANFRHFVAYSTGSSSYVLIGNRDTTPDSDPQIKPELQNRSVISVVIGDYHNAALTSNGKLFTWGSFSSGALGLGDPEKLEPDQPGAFTRARLREPPPVHTPTEVRFDHRLKKPKDRFCFSVTAAGWHTGALVIDLELDEEEDVYEMEKPDPEPPVNVHRRFETPPIAAGIFRIGHAGRGRGNFGGGWLGNFWSDGSDGGSQHN